MSKKIDLTSYPEKSVSQLLKGDITESHKRMEFVSVCNNRYKFKHVNGDFSVICEIPSDTNVDAKETLWFLVHESDNIEYIKN